MFDPEILKKRKEIQDKLNAISAELNAKGEELTGKRAHIEATFEVGSDEYNTELGALKPELELQKEKKNRWDDLYQFYQLTDEVETIEELAEIIEDEKEGKKGAVGGNPFEGVLGLPAAKGQGIIRQKGESTLYQKGTDYWGFLNDIGLIGEGAGVRQHQPIHQVKQKDGSTFFAAAQWHALIGKNQQEINQTVKSLGVDYGKSEVWDTALKTHREKTMKSMFTQHPLAGGDGSLYNPSEVFAGNTGGLCEYIIDDTIDVLPYPRTSFLDCVNIRRIPKSYVLFARQTLRVNNASAVAESIYLPNHLDENDQPDPIDFRVLKPENEYGFSQAKAYTLTFAATIEVSEEFLEDCPSVADIVESQLMEDVRQEFYDQFLNGDGSGGQYPELIGLFSTLGLSTRIHKGAASYMGTPMISGLATDNERMTFVRAIFDSEAFGGTVNCALMNHNDFVDYYLTQVDDVNRPLYTDQELRNILDAAVRYDVRVPAGAALIGDFRTAQMLIRRALRLDIGWTDKQFKQDMLTLRATMRGGLLVRAPHRIIRVTAL